MGVTQIVTLTEGREALQKSLQRLPTEKVVFVTRKERIKDVLSIRNEFALNYKLPTEVKVFNGDSREMANELKKQKNPVLHIIDHDELSYYLINISFILGIPVYFSDGEGMKQLPGLSSRFKDALSYDQIKVLENLKEESTHEQLALKTKFDNSLLFFYLYGKNSQTGLVKLGLVSDRDEKLNLTELGWLVVES
jgi:hypothetical protein